MKDTDRILAIIDGRLEKRSKEYEAEKEVVNRLCIMEAKGELMDLKLEMLKMDIERYTPHATFIHNTDPGDEQRVGIDL
jgi:septum formation inhibitor-activating ATPase MinD